MSDILLTEIRGRVVRLVMNRVDKRNALSAVLCRELVDSIHRANRDPNVGAILLAANGPVFSAGMDLHELGQIDQESLGNIQDQLFSVGTRLATPLIAAVDGPALGGGFGVVANAHIVVASERARFGLTEIRLGLWPFLIYRALEAALGERRVVELALTGRIIDVQEAKLAGLVQEIHQDPNAKAMEIAEQLANSSAPAVRGGLNFIQEARDKDWEMAGMIARSMREELFQSPDFAEGVRAFREKRKPLWPSLNPKKEISGS